MERSKQAWWTTNSGAIILGMTILFHAVMSGMAVGRVQAQLESIEQRVMRIERSLDK